MKNFAPHPLHLSFSKLKNKAGKREKIPQRRYNPLMNFTILVADDEENIRNGLEANFEMEGYAVKTASGGKEAIKIASDGEVDLVITDLRMEKGSGEEVVKTLGASHPDIPVIVLTAHGSIDSAVEAMRNGAYDFLTKPLNLDALNLIVKRALEKRSLAFSHELLKEEAGLNKSLERMKGESRAMRELQKLIKKVAPSRVSVLITGESGVGKELVASAIHNLSPRKNAPFVKVHLAALSDSLIESELFGHEKGAFTGAERLKRGRFELADGGTIFLDEIGEISSSTQIKLLRVLQEREFERVGGEKTIKADSRVIAATNRDLQEEIKKGAFREDLYYRLNVVHIHVPPLRDRKEDIPLLAAHFLREASRENGVPLPSISDEAKRTLVHYEWKGNIRELRNCMESALVLSSGGVIKVSDLPMGVRGKNEEEKSSITIPIGTTLAAAQEIVMRETLNFNGGNRSETAKMLGISRKTLFNRLEKE